MSVFLRDGDTVLPTYSGYSGYLDATDLLMGTDQLDLAPLGRQQVGMRHHDRYPENPS